MHQRHLPRELSETRNLQKAMCTLCIHLQYLRRLYHTSKPAIKHIYKRNYPDKVYEYIHCYWMQNKEREVSIQYPTITNVRLSLWHGFTHFLVVATPWR
jgi:hypothetical protein